MQFPTTKWKKTAELDRKDDLYGTLKLETPVKSEEMEEWAEDEEEPEKLNKVQRTCEDASPSAGPLSALQGRTKGL